MRTDLLSFTKRHLPREQINRKHINFQEQVDDFLLSLLLHSSGTPIRIVVITDAHSLSGDSDQSFKVFHPSCPFQKSTPCWWTADRRRWPRGWCSTWRTGTSQFQESVLCLSTLRGWLMERKNSFRSWRVMRRRDLRWNTKLSWFAHLFIIWLGWITYVPWFVHLINICCSWWTMTSTTTTFSILAQYTTKSFWNWKGWMTSL